MALFVLMNRYYLIISNDKGSTMLSGTTIRRGTTAAQKEQSPVGAGRGRLLGFVAK